MNNDSSAPDRLPHEAARKAATKSCSTTSNSTIIPTPGADGRRSGHRGHVFTSGSRLGRFTRRKSWKIKKETRDQRGAAFEVGITIDTLLFCSPKSDRRGLDFPLAALIPVPVAFVGPHLGMRGRVPCMVDLASEQVSHGHVDGLFRLSYRPFPVEEGLPPNDIGVSTLIPTPRHTSSYLTQDMHTVSGRRQRASLLLVPSPSASGHEFHGCHHSAIDPQAVSTIERRRPHVATADPASSGKSKDYLG